MNKYKSGVTKKYPKEYRAWCCLRSRVNDPTKAKWYADKGITVCAEWNNFYTFLEDMGMAPTPQHSMDRIDGNKGYYKDNCRWATKEEQANNRVNSSEYRISKMRSRFRVRTRVQGFSEIHLGSFDTREEAEEYVRRLSGA